MISIVRQRQATVNKRLKQWRILMQVHRHDIVDQSDVFAAILFITQLAISNCEPLFSAEYNE